MVTAKVVRQPMQMTLTLVGTVGPKTRSLIGSEVAGLVESMPARQGNLVAKGDLLCKLGQDMLGAELESAQAKLKSLESQLLELQNGTRAEDLTRIKANLDSAAARADRWSFELDRIRRLKGVDFANQREYQDALAEHLAAVGVQQAAQAEYDKAVAGPRAEVLAQATHEVSQQRAIVKRATLDFEKARIRAPYDGFVVARHAEVGNWLQVGGPVVELANTSSVLVRVDAPESVVPFAKIGAKVAVQIDALKKRYEGHIKHVIPQADEAARTFPVEVEVANPDYELKSGMFARVTVPAGEERMATVVRKDALIESDGSIFVAMVVDAEKGKMAIPVPVTLGADRGDMITITSNNLPPDATVVVYGNERLTYPQPVVPVESKEDVTTAGGHGPDSNPEDKNTGTGS
ncbi:MAG: hemolysin secretion protein D [Phycisphaerae bacterium]|nr:MAG: hemolysin secretion protein D [Phycisphaerae bacterium]